MTKEEALKVIEIGEYRIVRSLNTYTNFLMHYTLEVQSKDALGGIKWDYVNTSNLCGTLYDRRGDFLAEVFTRLEGIKGA